MTTVSSIASVTSTTDVIERYDVWERKPSGELRSCREDYSTFAIAKQTADEYNASEAEQGAMESGGPVKGEYSEFFVVMMTTTFEAVSS